MGKGKADERLKRKVYEKHLAKLHEDWSVSRSGSKRRA